MADSHNFVLDKKELQINPEYTLCKEIIQRKNDETLLFFIGIIVLTTQMTQNTKKVG